MVIFINFSLEGLLVLEFWLSKANISKKKKKKLKLINFLHSLTPNISNDNFEQDLKRNDIEDISLVKR